MRNSIFILAILLMISIISPAWAYSPQAGDFLVACRQTEAPFPPEGWSDEELRMAALEVLDAVESGSGDTWAISFCLQALGYAGCEEDIDRILAYEDELPRSVMRALRYVTHPKSIQCFLRWIDAEDTPERELALMGLQSMEYGEVKMADASIASLKTRLLEARGLETKGRLIVMIDEILQRISINE
jgi:hypothetical protein